MPLRDPRLFLVALLLVGLTACAGVSKSRSSTSGTATAEPWLAVGDVSSTSAVLWGRCGSGASLVFDVRPGGRSPLIPLSAENDFTAKWLLQDLSPQTAYFVKATCKTVSGESHTSGASFVSAPDASQPSALRLAWGGDVGGQNVCRTILGGYDIMKHVAAQKADLFIGLGDMIYADDPCLESGRFGDVQVPGPPAACSRGDFQAHWRYERSDPALAELLRHTPYAAVWDDHETTNDAGPQSDTRPARPDVHLLPAARQAFVDYNPILVDASVKPRLYRSLRWGKHLEVFLLDERSYRDANKQADGRNKTMLGKEQRQWFLDALQRSDATWKIIVTSVSLSIPTCTKEHGCDGWANFDQKTGFEQELLAILRDLQKARVRNMIWLATDVHFATGFRHQPFAGDRAFTFHEYVSGPLNAGLFPHDRFDKTLRPTRLFFYAPQAPNDVADLAEAQRWFNFGLTEIDADGTLHMKIINGFGEAIYEEKLTPAATQERRKTHSRKKK